MTHTLTAITPLTPAPLITFYDGLSGERTELSGITMGNWVAKVSNFLIDDLDAEIGTRLRISLPSHWLRYVWLLSCWNTGVIVADSNTDIGLSGPELEAEEEVKLASALAPFGMRFPTPPAGFVDIGVEVPNHSDHFEAFDEPSATDLAWDLTGETASHEQARAAVGAGNSQRLLLTENTLLADANHLIAACLGGGSLVVVRNANADQVQTFAEQEKAELLT